MSVRRTAGRYLTMCAVQCITQSSLLQYSTVRGNDFYLAWDIFSGCCDCISDSALDSAAAWDLHSCHEDASDVVLTQDSSQLFCIVDGVQFWTADESNMASYEIMMEISVGIGCAVRCDQKIGILKIRC